MKTFDKENLFEDLTADEMRERLQEVSEYMDELIKRRRCSCKLTGDDVEEDAQWNLAHDVLEIIHYPVSKPVEDLTLVINVDTTELDKAIEKAEKLISLISGLKVGVSVGKPKVGDGVKVENITIYE